MTGLTPGFGLRTAARYGIGNQVVPTGLGNKTPLTCLSQGRDPFGIFNSLTGVLTFPVGVPCMWRLYARVAFTAGGLGGGGADNGVGFRRVGFDIPTFGIWAFEDVPYISAVPASSTGATIVENTYTGTIDTSAIVNKLTLVVDHDAGVNRTIQTSNTQLGSPLGYCSLVIENLGPVG